MVHHKNDGRPDRQTVLWSFSAARPADRLQQVEDELLAEVERTRSVFILNPTEQTMGDFAEALKKFNDFVICGTLPSPFLPSSRKPRED